MPITDKNTQKCKPSEDDYNRFIEWYATAGQVYYDIETHLVVKRSSLTQLSRDLGFSRQALYKWPKIIPNFDDRLERAKQGILQTKIGSVWNALYLQALKGDWKAMEMFLINFDPNYISLRQKYIPTKPKQGSIQDLYNYVRAKYPEELI